MIAARDARESRRVGVVRDAAVTAVLVMTLGGRDASAQRPDAARGGDVPGGAVGLLAARAPGPRALTVSDGLREVAPVSIAVAPRELPRPSSAARVPAPPFFPCDGPCGPVLVRQNRCDDADRDGRCDVVFDPANQGGFWRALRRYVLLTWLWDEGSRR